MSSRKRQSCVARSLTRARWIVFMGAMWATLFAMSGWSQTLDEVIAKNIQARGGMAKLKAVQNVRTTARLSQGSFRADFVQENKRPGKVREEVIIQGLAQVQAYDGKTGWQISPFGGPLVEYKEKGHRAELVGHDSMEGTDCYKIKLSMKNGDVRNYYLDADSFLELKIEIQTTVRGALQESEIYYGDYEKVGGVYYPFAIEQAQKGIDSRTQFSVQKIEQNVALDDGHFSMPAGKEAKSAK